MYRDAHESPDCRHVFGVALPIFTSNVDLTINWYWIGASSRHLKNFAGSRRDESKLQLFAVKLSDYRRKE